MLQKTPDAVDVTVGRNVRLLRVQRGVSQEKLGEALGITFQQIQKYEKGTNRISSSKLSAIADYFNVDVASLFSGTGSSGQGGALIPFSAEAISVAQAYDSIQSAKVRQAVRNLIRKLSADGGSLDSFPVGQDTQ
ncbi:helix-turn-helix domain-containing protein [Rhizobiaceae bacterium n13]|uniref:Helix-turn-helix domain-containing protein n=1 Tax=Ferirhizobium litorale TaxID=2927786 RepID=A0AAE3U4T5_9HYPH|nr:helix-turn-helix transcriptional regulator [Fererhizobium litorale]MDI7864147.1 helix-turn-helix domain-containing protein [Fererhizobium litorale]MDI7923758.1 helix-turn-helix domain-containing protein [Fererhizobium litorale]